MALTKVSTDGVKDDAITSGKIPANAVGASELADNAVDTNAIANNAVTAGKTSGVQTTINNNADNRVITGSGSANTLNGESSVVIDANGKLGIKTTSPIGTLDIFDGTLVLSKTGTGTRNWRFLNNNLAAGNLGLQVSTATDGTTFSNVIEITKTGKVGINMGNASPDDTLDVNGTFQVSSNAYFSGTIYALGNDLRIGGTATANALDDYEEGTWTPTIFSGFNNVQYETYGRQGGYTKIGRYVFITMTIHMGGTTSTTSNGIQITGLPFNAKSFSHDNTNAGGLYITYHDGFSAQTQGLIQDGSNRIDLVRFDGSGSLTGTSVNAGREFRMAGSYMT